MLQDKDIDKIYDNDIEYPLYTAYMDKKKIQSCLMIFSTLEVVDDKHGHNKSNIELNAFPIKIFYGMDKLVRENGKTFKLISCKKTFAKMFKNSDIDIRDLVKNEVIAEVDFIIYSQRIYKIKRFKIKKEMSK